MTPDEVVDKISTLSEAGIIDEDERSALKTAISIIQDYQKLRGKIDKHSIARILYNSDGDDVPWKNNDVCWVDCEAQSQAIITYLQQPTEH